MTIRGALLSFTFAAKLSSCWMVFVSRSTMAWAASTLGWVLISMGKWLMRCFESRLIPLAAPISTSKPGRECFRRLAKAYAEHIASGSAL